VTATAQASFDAESPAPVALDLGWEMAELYSEARVRGKAPDPGSDLATLSDLNPWQRTQLAITHIKASLHRLGPSIQHAGLDAPGLDALQGAFAGGSDDALRSAVCDLHVQLLNVLYAADINLGTAYVLGRSLASTASQSHDAASLRDEFQANRLDVLKGWLADLATALPEHASRAVGISIGIWQEAVPAPKATPERWQVQDDVEHETRLQLHRQAKLWRAILTGAKDGHDMLQAKDYVAAAGRLFGRAARLVGQFVVRTYFVVPLILAGAGVGVWAILTSGGKTAANVVGALTVAAAALGITWKGTKSTLLELAVKLEQPLWDAELDSAIGEAITTLDTSARALKPGRIAAEIAPPQGPSLIELPTGSP
jgi:hypothetical protein